MTKHSFLVKILLIMTKKLILSISLLSLLVFSSTKIQANEANQSQNQEFEVECSTSGTYGQNTNCKVKGKQEQNQKIVYRSGKVLGYHDASKINAGLDPKMTLLFALIMLVGLSSSAVLVKSRIS